MNPEAYIDGLLKKHQKSPGFPFDDWVWNPSSFYELINIWSKIFKFSAGDFSGDYVAYGDAQQDEYSFIYRVRHIKRNVVIRIHPYWPVFRKKAGGYGRIIHIDSPLEMQPRDDEYELDICSDLDRDRLVCFFEMIRQFTHNLPENSADVERHTKMYIERYGKYFG